MTPLLGLTLRLGLALAPPTISAPVDGGLVCSDTVEISGNAITGSCSTTVDLSVGTLSPPALTPDSSGDWSTSVTVPSPGAYLISATVTDVSGICGVTTSTTTSPAAQVWFVVETAAPALAVGEPASFGQVYVTGTPTFSGTATPAARVTVELLDAQSADAGSISGPADAQGAWNLNAPASSLASGLYSAHVETSTDDACNFVNQVATAIRLDFDPPSLQRPAAAANLDVDQVTLAGAGIPGTRVVVTADGSVLQTVPVDPDGGWQVGATLASGPVTVTVQEEDATGGLGGQVTETFTVWLTQISTPTSGEVSPTEVSLSGGAAPATTVDLTVQGDGGVWTGTAVAADDGGWSAQATLAPGSYTLTAVDLAAGGQAGSFASVSFDVVGTASSSISTSTSASTSTSTTAGTSAATAGSSGSHGTSQAGASSGQSSGESTGSSASGSTGERSTSTGGASTSGPASSAATTSGSSAVGSTGSGNSDRGAYAACSCSSSDQPGLFLIAFALLTLGRSGRRRSRGGP